MTRARDWWRGDLTRVGQVRVSVGGPFRELCILLSEFYALITATNKWQSDLPVCFRQM